MRALPGEEMRRGRTNFGVAPRRALFAEGQLRPPTSVTAIDSTASFWHERWVHVTLPEERVSLGHDSFGGVEDPLKNRGPAVLELLCVPPSLPPRYDKLQWCSRGATCGR